MMITLITYPKYAIAGAKKGLEICLYTVIPTLFPFCVLVTLFRSNSNDKHSKFICIIEHVLNLPRGVGSLIGFGLLGGYPVGALCVEQAVEDGNITSDNAKYLRPICNNAGPAFIIGIVSGCFEKKFLPLNLLWIQALSVLYTLSLLPQENVEVIKKHSPETMNVQKAITLAFGSMINICGIIILFRCFLNILEKL